MSQRPSADGSATRANDGKREQTRASASRRRARSASRAAPCSARSARCSPRSCAPSCAGRPDAVAPTTEQTPCAPGSIAPSANMSACELCSIGRFAASNTACEECEAGTYAASEGLSQCTLCPYPLGSGSGDVTCSFCKEGFYLKDASADSDDIFENPTKHCKSCRSQCRSMSACRNLAEM